MNIINNEAAMAHALDSMADDDPVKTLLRRRTNELAGDGYTVSDLACFVIIEPCDTLSTIEAELNLPIVTNAIDGSRYGDPDWTPSWEWILTHGNVHEMVFVLDDAGFGHVIIVPDSEDIDATLLSLCHEYGERPEAS